MAERLAYLEAVVGADVTQFRKGMRDIRNEVGFLSETMSGLAGLGRSLTFAFTTPVLALGTAAISAASSFEASMYNINSIAGLTADQLEALSQRTLEFGSRTREGAQAASEALYTVFSAGITNVEDAFSLMTVATRTAEAGLADIGTTTETLAAILLSYGDTSEAAANRASDAITRMVALGVGNMQTFASALSSVVPTAAAIGMEFNDLAADMAFLTQRGLSAARAGVSMNAALTQLINPTEAMSAAFAELGADGLPDLIEKFGGVNEALEAVINTAGGDTTKLFSMFNSIQSRRAVGLFAEGMDAWQTTLDEFEAGVEGSTMRAWEEQMKSFAASWDLLLAAVSGAGIAIGQTVLPVLQPFVDALTDLLLVIVDTNPEILGMGAAFVTVAAAIPPLLWLIGSLVTPFGLVLGAVSALGIAFATDFGGIATTVKTTVDSVLAALEPLKNEFEILWNTIFPTEIELGTIPINGSIENPMNTISVDRPSSLWEIYEANGYAELFTWDAFMEEALKGGWDGGVIDIGELITIGGAPTIEIGSGVEALQNFENTLQNIAPASDSLWDRIVLGVSRVWPAIQTQLGILWDGFRTWLDETGANVVNGIAGWFTAGAGSNIYTAFTSLLNGDIVGAINAVIPNAGTKLATAIGEWDISSAFPQLSQAFGTLLSNVGNWLLTTGIPMFFQSLGFLGGKLVDWVSEGFATLQSWFTSGNASKTADAVKQYVQDGILTPFNEGFEQATGIDLGQLFNDADLDTKINDIIATVTPLWEALNFDYVASGFGQLVTGISDLIDDLATSDWTGLTTLTGAIVAIANVLIGGVATGIGDILSGLGTSLKGINDALSGIVSGNYEQAVTGLIEAFAGFGGAIILAVVDTLQTMVNLVNELFNLDLPNLTVWADQIRAQVDAAYASVQAMNTNTEPITTTIPIDFDVAVTLEAPEDLNLQNLLNSGSSGLGTINVENSAGFFGIGAGQSLTVTVPANIEWSPETVQTVLDVATVSRNMDLSEAERQAAAELMNAWHKSMSPEDQAAFMTILENYYSTAVNDGAIITPDGWTIEIANGQIVTSIDPASVTNTMDGELPPVTGTVDLELQAQTLSHLPTANGEPIAVTEPVPVTAPVELTPIAATFADDFIGGMSTETIINENFVPLQEAWNAMFAADGTMATSFSTFSTGVTTGWTGIETEMNDVIGLMNDDLPAAMGTFEGASEPFVNTINKVRMAVEAANMEVNELKTAIKELLQLEGSLSLNVTVTSTTPDGSHKTGLMSVPYDGYIAELHKGEMVLTANEANQYKNAEISQEAAMPVTRDMGGSTSYNEINVKSNLTVDQFLYEMNRRGIKLK
jgi:TP901 family phage tail tape measure protein